MNEPTTFPSLPTSLQPNHLDPNSDNPFIFTYLEYYNLLIEDIYPASIAPQRSNNVTLLIGDSITYGLKNDGSNHYEGLITHEQSQGRNIVNYAVPGDMIHHMTYRVTSMGAFGINHNALDVQRIIILAGTNNANAYTSIPPYYNSDNFVGDSKALVMACHQLYPNAKILIWGILPRVDTPATQNVINLYNNALKHSVAPIGNYVQYIDPVALTSKDYITERYNNMVITDLHPNTSGNQKLIGALMGIIPSM